MFNSFEDLAHARDEVVTEFAEATVGRLGGPADAATINRQLVAAERLRTHLTLQVSIAQTMIATANGTPGKWKPIKRVRWERLSEVIEQEGALCERTAMAVLKSAGQGAMRPRKSG
jgi:hypothetical protein